MGRRDRDQVPPESPAPDLERPPEAAPPPQEPPSTEDAQATEDATKAQDPPDEPGPEEEIEAGLVPLIPPDGVSSALVSRAYEPKMGLFWVTPEDAEVLITRHDFSRG
jgi:hypothetical protein